MMNELDGESFIADKRYIEIELYGEVVTPELMTPKELVKYEKNKKQGGMK